MAQRVGRVIALLFLDRGTRRGEWSVARPVRILPPGKDPVAGISRPHRDSIPDRPARSSVAIPTELPDTHTHTHTHTHTPTHPKLLRRGTCLLVVCK